MSDREPFGLSIAIGKFTIEMVAVVDRAVQSAVEEWVRVAQIDLDTLPTRLEFRTYEERPGKRFIFDRLLAREVVEIEWGLEGTSFFARAKPIDAPSPPFGS